MTQPDSSLCPSELMHACQQMLLAATPKAVYRQLAGIIDHHFDLDACCVTSMSDGQQFLYGREDTDAIDRVHTRTCTQAFVRIPEQNRYRYEVLVSLDDQTTLTFSWSNGAQKPDLRLIDELIGLARAVIQRIKQEHTWIERASKDPLTGLYNRLALKDIAQTMAHKPVCVLLVDVDHLKQINDTWGHQAGDRTLVCVASAIVKAIRSCDYAFRCGGDEFLILAPDCTDGDDIIDRIKKMLRREHDHQQIPISVSAGWSFCDRDRFCIDEMIAQADKVMYDRKMTRCS